MALESVAECRWNQRLNGTGIGGRMPSESVTEWHWNGWPNAVGIGGRMGLEYAASYLFTPPMGDLARVTGRFDQAWLYLEEASGLLRTLVAAEPGRADFRRELSITLNRLGSLALDTGQREAAREYVNEAIALRNALAEAEPWRADLQVELAEGYWNDYRLAGDRPVQRQALGKIRSILQPPREQGLQHRDLNHWWEQAAQARPTLE